MAGIPRFENVVILGMGAMAARCAAVLLASGLRPHRIIETGFQPLSSLQGLSRREDVPYERALGAKVTKILEQMEGPSLLLSVNNNYLFPLHLCERKEFRIVNFHNAPLPRYPGRDISTWAVFNGEKSHGSTWHLVDHGVDTGNILCQEQFPVSSLSTALTLMSDAIQAGVRLFSKHWKTLVDPDMEGIPQLRREPLYYSWDIPLGGNFPLGEDFTLCDRFLRSLDYGPLPVLPPPRLIWNDTSLVVDKYQVLQGEKNTGRDKVSILGGGRWSASLHYPEGVIQLFMTEEKHHERHEQVGEALECVAP